MLDREDMMQAVSEGVRIAIEEMMRSQTRFPYEDFLKAIENGAEEGIYRATERERVLALRKDRGETGL